MPGTADTSCTSFRLAEKYFKNRSVPGQHPCLLDRGVIDLSRPAQQDDDEIWQAGWWASSQYDPHLSPRSRRRAFRGKDSEKGERPGPAAEDLRRIELKDGRGGWVVAEGCILIPQCLDEDAQLCLAERALADYTRPPNPLSLSTHYRSPENLFELYARQSAELILPVHSSPLSIDQLKTSLRREQVDTPPASVSGYGEILARNKNWRGDQPSDKVGPKTACQLMSEIRWANLGWVYQWSTKSYDFAPREPFPFPSDLAGFCSLMVQEIPWRDVFGSSEDDTDWADWAANYVPDTGIVNFYQLKDTLMGHVDRAEIDPSRPLVSISLGHAAIFLLGSSSRDVPPIPIILRSGDVLVMSGRGRQFYHGIPRVLEGTIPKHFSISVTDSCRLRAAKRWFESGRININARQVFPPGFARPLEA